MGLLSLILMGLAMGGSSFLVGCLPLSLTFSRFRLKMVSTYGMGLLVGAAMAIIIPEGIETLYASLQATDARPAELHADPAATIAISLLCGFSLMLIVEQLGSAHGSHISPSNAAAYELSENGAVPSLGAAHTSLAHSKSWTATLGLVIHSFADGIALGASSISDNSELELLVFLAIMIHKAPAALGLCTTLLGNAEPRARVRQYLLAFSAAAPVGAFFTYGAVWSLGSGQNLHWWTGVALLFSGGTFLYVATVIQDVSGHSHMPETGEGGPSEDLSSVLRTVLLIGGMFTPFVLSVAGQGHGH